MQNPFKATWRLAFTTPSQNNKAPGEFTLGQSKLFFPSTFVLVCIGPILFPRLGLPGSGSCSLILGSQLPPDASFQVSSMASGIAAIHI